MPIKIKKRNPAPIINIKVLKRLENYLNRMDAKLRMLEMEANAIVNTIEDGNFVESEMKRAIANWYRGFRPYIAQMKIFKEDYEKYPNEVNFLFRKGKKHSANMKIFDMDKEEVVDVQVPFFIHDDPQKYIDEIKIMQKWIEDLKKTFNIK